MRNRKPELTVVIPTYNRSTVLKRCLDALTGQTLSADLYEIIVTDDGSSDDTRQTVERCAAGSQVPVSYLWQSNAGANAARNLAITEARGRLLLFINNDTMLLPPCLPSIFRLISSIWMRTLPSWVESPYRRKFHIPCLQKFTWTRATPNGGKKRELDWRAFYTCNISVKKSFLVKYGLFEESIRYNDDVELGERLSHHGLRVIYNPHALGYHYHYLQEKDYLDLAKRDGTGMAKWYKKISPFEKRTRIHRLLSIHGYGQTDPVFF